MYLFIFLVYQALARLGDMGDTRPGSWPSVCDICMYNMFNIVLCNAGFIFFVCGLCGRCMLEALVAAVLGNLTMFYVFGLYLR